MRNEWAADTRHGDTKTVLAKHQTAHIGPIPNRLQVWMPPLARAGVKLRE